MFAAPVLPFFGNGGAVTDKPGARHLTCQLSVQVRGEVSYLAPRGARYGPYGDGVGVWFPRIATFCALVSDLFLLLCDKDLTDHAAVVTEVSFVPLRNDHGLAFLAACAAS